MQHAHTSPQQFVSGVDSPGSTGEHYLLEQCCGEETWGDTCDHRYTEKAKF